MKLDILAIAAHPDDVELSASGTLIKEIQNGRKVGVVDLTRGELGTRGTPELRHEEATKSSEIMGLSIRENLGLADGFFVNDRESQLAVIQKIRQYQPDIVITNAIHDRHIDHGKGSELVSHACFLSGLRKVETASEGRLQEAWRPKAVYHFVQDRYIEPDFVVDITPYWEDKMKSIMAFSSQFFNPDSKEPSSPISSPEFMEYIEGRASAFGRLMNVRYGEGFTVERTPGVDSILDLI